MRQTHTTLRYLAPVSDSYAKYVGCRDKLRNKLYPGERSAECIKKGAEEAQEIAAEANAKGNLPEPPTIRTDFNLDNAYFEAFVEAATECLKEFPLAGLDRRFRDVDVGKTFEPGWDTKLQDIIDFFVK